MRNKKPPPDGGDKGLFDQFGKVLDEIIPEEDGRRGKVAAFPPGKIDVAAAVGGVEMGTRAMCSSSISCQVRMGMKEMPMPARISSRTVSGLSLSRTTLGSKPAILQ